MYVTSQQKACLSTNNASSLLGKVAKNWNLYFKSFSNYTLSYLILLQELELHIQNIETEIEELKAKKHPFTIDQIIACEKKVNFKWVHIKFYNTVEYHDK